MYRHGAPARLVFLLRGREMTLLPGGTKQGRWPGRTGQLSLHLHVRCVKATGGEMAINCKTNSWSHQATTRSAQRRALRDRAHKGSDRRAYSTERGAYFLIRC